MTEVRFGVPSVPSTYVAHGVAYCAINLLKITYASAER